MHESDVGHPSDISSSKLTDEVVNTVVAAGGGAAAGGDAHAGRLQGGDGCAAGGHEPHALPPLAVYRETLDEDHPHVAGALKNMIQRLTVATQELAESGETAREKTTELEGIMATQRCA